eukprot:2140568-Alexandrium_andersonii.AAC.1
MAQARLAPAFKLTENRGQALKHCREGPEEVGHNGLVDHFDLRPLPARGGRAGRNVLAPG